MPELEPTNDQPSPEPPQAASTSPELLRDTEGFLPPQTELEQQLARIWADLLRIEPIGRSDDFFELGGHSLLASQVVAHVRTSLQIEATMPDLFDAPTLGAFAALLEKRKNNQAAVPSLKKLARTIRLGAAELLMTLSIYEFCI